MQTVLVLGAGRSAIFLIEYLSRWCGSHHWRLIVADQSASLLEPYAQDGNIQTALVHPNDTETRNRLIAEAHLVVSMLPAFMHPEIAKACIESGTHLATASYESAEMRTMRPLIEAKGLQFLNECGLDPGLDHLSAMRIINRLRRQGAHITAFRSYCGGLVAKECIDNPWGYKFSWNPRNVIIAGQGTAQYLENGRLKYVPYHRLFTRPETIRFDNGEAYDGYPNRDSLGYREIYGLEDVQTMIRGTLRHQGYCRAWNIFVQMGITDDSYLFALSPGTTYRAFSSAFLPDAGSGDEEFRKLLGPEYETEAIEKVKWTGITEDISIGLQRGTPAAILQHLLEDKWKMRPGDRDLVIMQHQFEYSLTGKTHRISSSLYLEGENERYTAMARTVGLPLAIAVKRLLEGSYTRKGLLLPVDEELYEPVLQELEQDHGIRFNESES